MRVLLSSLASFVLSVPGIAQTPCGLPGVTASVEPPVAEPGQVVDVILFNGSGQTIFLTSSCVYAAVFANATCTPPSAFEPYCFYEITPIPDGQYRSATWDQTNSAGQQVPTETASFEVSYVNEDSTASFECCPTLVIAEGGAIPAMSPWMLALLVGILAVAGVWAVRRRARFEPLRR